MRSTLSEITRIHAWLIHFGNYLHPQQCSLPPLIRGMYQSRRQESNNDRRHAFCEQAFPGTPKIWNKLVMHELDRKKRNEPYSEKDQLKAWTGNPVCGTIAAGKRLSSRKMSHINPQISVAA